jgi:hypothetical protein
MNRIPSVICLWVICLTSCVSSSGPTTRAPARVNYGGFSIEQQEGRRWRLNPDEQTYYRAIARLDLRSSTHSFSASVALSTVGGEPKSPEDLKEFVRSSFVVDDTNRYTLLDLQVSIRTNQGLTGVMYTQRALDRNPIGSSTPLVIVQHGYVTRHPYDPNIILDAMYLERGREEQVGQPECTSLGEAFLKGVRFERLP